MSNHASSAHRTALLQLLITSVLWSSSGLFVKMLTWQPLAIMGMRSAFASIVFLLYLRSFRIEWNRWLVAGALAQICTQMLFISSTKLTTAANAIFLQYTAPLYVIILGWWILGERPQSADWLTMPFTFLGLGLFFAGQLSLDGALGNWLAVAGGLTLALMTISMRKQPPGTTTQTVLLANLVGALIGLPFSLRESWSVPNLAILAYLGIVQIGVAMLLYSLAIRHVNALETTLITTLEPILNPLWVFLVLGERPGQWALVGGAIVVGAALGRAILSHRASWLPFPTS